MTDWSWAISHVMMSQPFISYLHCVSLQSTSLVWRQQKTLANLGQTHALSLMAAFLTKL